MNCAMARQSIALTPPDILVSLPYDSYQGVAAYAQAGEIIEKGRELMSEALDRYERDERNHPVTASSSALARRLPS
jgi:hypothetical protein